MCNAFKANGLHVTLVLNSSYNIDLQKAYKILKSQYGDLVDFDLCLNTSMQARFNRFGKYVNNGYYKKIINDISPDVCFVRAPLMMRACVKSKVKYIYETHNNKMHLGSSFLSNYWSKILKKESKKDRLLTIIAISENLKKYWVKKGIEESRIIALHDGFPFNMFTPETSKEKARKNLDLPLDRKIVLYSGSLFADREIHNIVMLSENIPEALFIVVGGPQENANHLQNLADKKRLNNIRFVGRMAHNKIPQYLFASDILLGLWSKNVPTINYCSPLKIFEYMASGRIIVAHSFPTIKEVLTDNKNALLTAPNEYGHLLLKVQEALSLSYPNPIAENARQEALHRYTWGHRAQKIIESIS